MSAVIAGRLVVGVAIGTAIGSGSATANDFTAEKVMKEMDEVQRYMFTVGVVEGLAVARYFKDGKVKTGMECIYDWFYEDKQTIKTIYAAYERYPTYPPGSLIYSLANRKCGV